MALIKVGQGWYAMLPGETEVVKTQIVELTTQTVVLDVSRKSKRFPGSNEHIEQRFAIDQVDFMEKLYD